MLSVVSLSNSSYGWNINSCFVGKAGEQRIGLVGW